MILEPLAEFWWRWSLPAAVQATPMLLLAAAFDLLLPRLTGPGWRAALWIAAAWKLVLPSAWFAPWGLLPRWQSAGGVPTEPLAVWASIVPAVWLAGSMLLATGGCLWLRRSVHRWKVDEVPVHSQRFQAIAKAMGVAPPILYESPHLSGPVVTGLFRPALFWPAGAHAFLTAAEQEQAMRHELAHLLRRDPWRHLAWSALLLVFWFHPLLWWCIRRVRAIREQSCDRTASRLPGTVAQATGPPSSK